MESSAASARSAAWALGRAMNWEDYKIPKDFPQGIDGNASVYQFNISPLGATLANIGTPHHRHVMEGDYTGLRINGDVMMSDTRAEIMDHWNLFYNAQGRVLVHGLGLGVALDGVLRKTDVEHVTVVEINPCVIRLVAPYWQAKHGERLTIVEADALKHTWPKGTRFDCVWHDIWPSICGDNWDEYKYFTRSWANRCGWQGAWVKDEVRRLAKEVW